MRYRKEELPTILFHSSSCIDSYLEENKPAKPKNFSLHGASEVSFPPEINGGEDVRKSNQPSPHTMTPLHVEDELKLWQSHVMVHSGKKTMRTDNLKEPYYVLLPQVDMVLCGLNEIAKTYFGPNTTRIIINGILFSQV